MRQHSKNCRNNGSITNTIDVVCCINKMSSPHTTTQQHVQNCKILISSIPTHKGNKTFSGRLAIELDVCHVRKFFR